MDDLICPNPTLSQRHMINSSVLFIGLSEFDGFIGFVVLIEFIGFVEFVGLIEFIGFIELIEQGIV